MFIVSGFFLAMSLLGVFATDFVMLEEAAIFLDVP